MGLMQDWFGEQPNAEVLFERRLLAFVDILGWSEILSKRRDTEIARSIMSGAVYLRTASEGEAERQRQFRELGLPFGHTIRTSMFSDTIIYSSAPDRDEAGWLVGEVQRVCDLLLSMGHYTRGAIVVGDLAETSRSK